MWNETSFSTNFVDYSNIIENTIDQKDYLDTFSKIFIGNNNKTSDVIINGIESWDRNKKMQYF